MTTVFTDIINGNNKQQKVFWEDNAYVAFLTHRPHTKGHTLVVPKKEYPTYLDMPEDEYVAYMLACKNISQALQSIFSPAHIGVGISGFEVPHVHVHLIPMNSPEELDTKMAHDVGLEELEKLTEFLKSEMGNL